jgi:hypothetical protein
MDHTREVPTGATETRRTVCKETLQSLVKTTSTKMDTENKPKEPVMPDKEEAEWPFVMKKYKTELKQYYFKKER